MKNLIIKTITLGAAIVLSLAGTVGANADTKTYGYKHFTKLELGRAVSNITTADYNRTHFGGNKADRGDNAPLLRVKIVKSESYGVEISVSEEYAELYNIVLHNDALEVVVKRYNVRDKEKVKYRPVADVTIHLPLLTSLTVRGWVEITMDGEFETDESFRLDMSGATKLDDLRVKADRISLGVSGAAKINDIDASAAKVDFNATEKATYSSSGQATVRPHGKNASVSTENGKTTVRMGYDD